MNLASIEKVIVEFISSNDSSVMVIKGKWGVGKTFYWKNLVRTHGAIMRPGTYSYTSLFGIHSIDRLQSEIFFNRDTLSADQTVSDDESTSNIIHIASKTLSWAKKKWRGLIKWIPKLKPAIGEIPHLKGVSIGIDTIAPLFIKNLFICIDDFERLIGDQRIAKELIGFISSLKEEKKCKVILIFNEDELDEDQLEVYRKYKEKVIDKEIEYKPSPEDAIALLNGGSPPIGQEISARCVQLGITNMRIINKIRDYSDMIRRSIPGMDNHVYLHIDHSVALFVYASLTNEDVPKTDFIKRWNALAWGMRTASLSGQEPNVSSQEKEWANFLSRYNYKETDDLDLAIFSIIENGYIEGSGVNDCALSN